MKTGKLFKGVRGRKGKAVLQPKSNTASLNLWSPYLWYTEKEAENTNCFSFEKL